MTVSRREVVKARVAAGAAIPIPPALSAASTASRTVRKVKTSDLHVFEPIFTTANVTADHGAAIYGMLLPLDCKCRPEPQIVTKCGGSDGRKTHTFELRGGLRWHDCTPIMVASYIASIGRRGDGHQIISMWNIQKG